MRKLKICILTSTFPRFNDDNFGIFIYRNAAALAEAGTEVHVITPSAKDAQTFEIMDGIRVYRFRYWIPPKFQKVAYRDSILQNLRTNRLAKIQLPFFLISFLCKSLIVARKCDIIHAQWIPTAFPGLFTKLLYHIPVAVSIRGTDIRVLARGILMRKVTKFILDRVDQVISLAPGESILARELGDYEIIETHNPLDGNKFNPDIPFANLKKEFNLHDELIVSFIGRLFPETDPLTFVEAIPSVIKQFSNVKFFIVGFGILKDEVEKKIIELNIGEFVILTGNRQDTNVFHAATDIYVNPRVYENLWNNSMIEAMASGCACIVTTAGEVTNYLTHMKNVYMIPPQNPEKLAEALILLLNDKNIRDSLIQNARAYIKENPFYKQEVVNHLLSIYRNMLRMNKS